MVDCPLGFVGVWRGLKETVEELNHLVVRVVDATGNFQARGKQSKSPHGIWYTRVSGIWQTVWLETASQRTWRWFFHMFWCFLTVFEHYFCVSFFPGFRKSCLFAIFMWGLLVWRSFSSCLVVASTSSHVLSPNALSISDLRLPHRARGASLCSASDFRGPRGFRLDTARGADGEGEQGWLKIGCAFFGFELNHPDLWLEVWWETWLLALFGDSSN